MAENDPKVGEQQATDPAEVKTDPAENPAEPTQQKPEPKTPDDAHGHPTISAGKYERDMKEKDEKIAELEAKVAEASKSEEARTELQKEIDELKEKQEDERMNYKLELAGCLDVKAAKAVLSDHGNDVEQLKKDCPYLFQASVKGSTGKKPEGAAGSTESRLAEARKAAGVKIKE